MAAAKSKTRRAQSGSARKAGAAKQPPQEAVLADALAEAAWAEADAALAQALVDLDEAAAAVSEAAGAEALALVAQSLSRAARKRGLTRVGALGAAEPYDPQRHDLNSPVAQAPKTVRIEARGVARGDQLLAKPRVGPVRGKKKRP
jgi:hypothetical protein